MLLVVSVNKVHLYNVSSFQAWYNLPASDNYDRVITTCASYHNAGTPTPIDIIIVIKLQQHDIINGYHIPTSTPYQPMRHCPVCTNGDKVFKE